MNPFATEHGSNRDIAAGECLGENDDIRIDIAIMLEREKRSGATDTALNFVGNEQRAIFTAKSGSRSQIARRRNIHPLALDGLNNKGGNVLFAQLRLQSVEIVKGNGARIAEKGSK